MIKHNLKLILRHLWRKRIYSSVILLSLTVGFACSAILIAFLVYETGTDTFHSKHVRVFQVFSDDPFEGKGKISFIPNSFADYAQERYPELETICQANIVREASIEMEAARFDDFTVLSVDTAFFSLFDFPLAHGNRNTCLAPGRIVLSSEKARIIFGRTDVTNEVLTVHTPDTTVNLAVSGVTGYSQGNTHLRFDALVHPSLLGKKWRGGVTYVMLQESNARQQLAQKINEDESRPGLMGPGKSVYFFNPLTDSYFNGDNKMPFMKTRSPAFIKVVYVVCGLILFISSFNFINLFLLFGQDRKKEMGIKKTLGVSQTNMIGFSLSEALVYISISCFLGILLVWFVIPLFNTVFRSALSLAFFLQKDVLIPIGAVLLFAAGLVILIPLLKQSRMKPIALMAKSPSKVRFSRVLFTMQFVISITLAICAVTIVQQMRHIERSPLGFNRNLVQLNGPGFKFSESLPALKQGVAQLPDVNNVAVSGGNPISGNSVLRAELEDGRFYSLYLFGGDEDFLNTLDLELIEGQFPTKENHGKLVNETLVRQFDMKNPIGEKIPGTDDVILGVVKDFTVSSFKQEIPCVSISYYENGRALLVDYGGNNLARLIPQLHEEWKKVFPDHAFDYQVVQQDLMNKHKDDIFLFHIVISFSVISIVLSCFGLFALSWAVVQNRTKEMGIRKVLGATSMDILNLLTLSFTKRIGIAFLLAIPIGYYFMELWLVGFVNRIDLGFPIFAIAAVIMVIVSITTLSVHTIKATMTNPVDELRTE